VVKNKSGCQKAEELMTPEQGERYQMLLKYEAEYWETGDGFGGRYFRNYEKESMMAAVLHEFCCEVLGTHPYPAKPLPPGLLRNTSDIN